MSSHESDTDLTDSPKPPPSVQPTPLCLPSSPQDDSLAVRSWHRDDSHPPFVLLSPHTQAGLFHQEQLQQQHQDRKCADDFITTSPAALAEQPYYRNLLGSDVILQARNSNRVLTILLVLGLNFFLTCGGPVGSEFVAVPGGPLPGLLLMVLFPICFSVPFAFVVAELCTAFPDDGGFVLWVKNAFGPFWGFQQGYWAWISSVFCNALFPMAIYSALASVYGDFASAFGQYLIKASLAIALSLPTLIGARCASYLCLVLTVLVMLPYMIFSIWSFSDSPDFDLIDDVRDGNASFVDLQTHQDVTQDLGSIYWMDLLTTVFWCYDGIYRVSLFGGQVRNPSYTYPRAIFGNLFLTFLSRIIPLTAVIVVGFQHWSQFNENSMSIAAGIMGGRSFRNLLVFAAICSTSGRFLSETFCSSHQLNGMAETGLVPDVLSRRHSYFRTPYVAVVANTLPVLCLLKTDYQVLVNAGNAFSAIVQIMIVFAAIKLRISHHDIHRPTKVPGGLFVFVLLMAIPLLVLGVAVYNTFTHSVSRLIFAGGTAIGMVYGAIQFVYMPKRSMDLRPFEIPRRAAAF